MILSALLFISAASYGQKTVSRLFSDFSGSKGVEQVKLGSFMMKFARFAGGDTMGVEAVEVLSFNRCEDALKVSLDKAIHALKDERYETLLTSNEDGQHTKVMVMLKDDVISELVVLTTGNEPALVRIKGKIRLSDLERVIPE